MPRVHLSALLVLVAARHASGAIAGPATGGRIILSAPRPAECAGHVCTFGTGRNDNSTNHSTALLIGDGEQGTSWSCDVPAAVDAGAAAVLEWDAVRKDAEFHGSAMPIDGGIIQLTSVDQYIMIGTLIMLPPISQPDAGTASFALSFDLLVGRGTGGEGFSISLVDDKTLLQADEMGAPKGLVVSFNTGIERVRVVWRGEALADGRMDGKHPSACDIYNCANCKHDLACVHAGCKWMPWQQLCDHADDQVDYKHFFRRSTFAPVNLSIADERLSVWHNEFAYVTNLHVPGWEQMATRAAWRVVLGARNTLRVDEHSVRGVRMVQGALVGEAHTTVAIGGNDSACVHNFSYYAAPVVSRVGLQRGPVHGGTPVLVYGANLHRGGDSPAACKFGETSVPATRRPENAALECLSPNASTSGAVALEVSLNDIDFSSSSPSADSTFTYTDARVERVEPSRTSSSEGGLLMIRGTGFVGGTKYVCGFGNAGTAPAFLDAHEGFIYCAAPAMWSTPSMSQ